ncbi:MAG TPA: sugar phosphate isomerase/epimerase [Bryobacteraceae bacterium]|nr:sugar phosphate isomerase/epimerase [Bryobacteraceae bacterium]
MTLSRRDFARVGAAALPLARLIGAVAKPIDSKIAGVRIGVQTYSFRDLGIDDAIQAMVADKLGECELFSPHIEAGGVRALLSIWDPPPGVKRTEEETRAAYKAYAEKVRAWRLGVGLGYFADVKKKFDDAGVRLYAYNLSFGDDWEDEEIDRGFLMAKALGVGIITASTTLTAAKRVAPYAEKHKMLVAMHGHSDLKDPNQFCTPDSFAKALAMSKYYRINLDIGHFTAAGFDAVDFIEKNHAKIVLLHLKDRKRNDGPNTPWGEGDTPIKPVLQLLKKNRYPIPAFIEYEYDGKGTSEQEVAKCFEFCKHALA